MKVEMRRIGSIRKEMLLALASLYGDGIEQRYEPFSITKAERMTGPDAVVSN